MNRATLVSIPYGTIKSECVIKHFLGETCFNSLWYN